MSHHLVRRRSLHARSILVPLAAAAALIVLLIGPGARPASAQGVTVTGQVVDSAVSEPIPSVVVQLIAPGGRVVSSVLTDDGGRFRFLNVRPGTYALAFSAVGYENRRMEDVRVASGPLNLERVALISRAFELNPVVVTASRHREKALEAPADVQTVQPQQIEEQPAATAVDYLKGLPGVDVVTNGLSQHNVVARGFNNIFSTALLVLTDYRWASVPSLRFNAYNLIPQTNEDIERIEFVLGPGSALYGPNVQNGVMHIITKSPLESQGTTASVFGGTRDVFKGTFRYAGLVNENLGYKVSGTYFRGTDWRFTDPVEAENQVAAQACLSDPVASNPACTPFLPAPGVPPNPDRLRRIGNRDFTQERASGTARVDIRFDPRSTLVLEGGATRLGSSIEMTGIGAAQGDDWTYSYAQARLNHGDLFAQSYINLSNAGDTYTLRDAQPIVDNSLLWVAQVQNANAVGDRQRFIYGVDFIRTVPRTKGTINGQNENHDNITEVGGYVQSETHLNPKVDLVAAARADYHSVLDNVVLSPRAAVVYKPAPGQNFRLTYNRAFSDPTSNNLFLDIQASPTLGPFTSYAVRATGSETGFTFRRDCVGPAGPGLCMRSPFAPNPSQFLPLDATPFWSAAVAGLAGLVQAGQLPALGTSLDPAIENALLGIDPSGRVGTILKRLNPTTGEFGNPISNVQDIAPIKPTIQNTLEAGYKGVIADRLLLGIDLYYTHIQDFIGPLLVETPNAFLDPQTLGALLGDTLAALGLNQGQILSVIGGLTNIPLGTVTPENTPGRPTDLFLTYRNFGNVDLWGTDLGATLVLSDALSFGGSYSFVNRNFFRNLAGITDMALNAPKNKASLSVQYRGREDNGLAASVTGRYVDAFDVNSGVYVGHIPSYTVFDVNATYTLPFSRGTDVTLSAYNVFDKRHQEIIGAPFLGRLVLLRLRQTF